MKIEKKIFIHIRTIGQMAIYKRSGNGNVGRMRYVIFFLADNRRRWVGDYTNLRKAERRAKKGCFTTVFPTYGDAAVASGK